MTGFVILFLFNLGITFWNVYVTGTCWAEAGAVGGLRKFMAWMGATMSAIGFTMTYAVAIVLVLLSSGSIDTATASLVFNVTYVLLVPALLFSGYAIMFHSWARAFRRGGFVNYGRATYNSWAGYHTSMGAVNNYGAAVGNVFGSFKPKNGDQAKVMIALLIAAISIGLGVLTTWLIISRLTASHPLPEYPPVNNPTVEPVTPR